MKRLAPMLEKDVERKVCEFAKQKGCYCRKFNSMGHAAVPDRIYHTPSGRTFYIEFKRPGVKSATPAQLVEHAKIRACKVPVFLVNDVQKGKAIIDAMLSDDEY